MNDELLKYYNRELAYIRQMGANFAEKYPKVAGRLHLTDEQVEDPHVSRLIESFAFLTAQIRQKLDDSFPELTDAMMVQMYPDYHAPIPSMSVIKMTTEHLSTTGVTLKRGTSLESTSTEVSTCYFRTTSDNYLWPIEITNASFHNAPFTAPPCLGHTPAKSMIKVELQGEYPDVSLYDTNMDKLQVYINGQPHQKYKVYELIFKHCIGIAIEEESTGDHSYIPLTHLSDVGFGAEEASIPYSARMADGYRILVENFLFPEKFMFFQLDKIKPYLPKNDSKCQLYFYFDKSSNELEKQITSENFVLGCVPIINLFEKELENVPIEISQYEYKLAAQYQSASSFEVIQVQDVTAYDQKQNSYTVKPFYGQTHPKYQHDAQIFWQIRRESSQWSRGDQSIGTDTYLSFVDSEQKELTPATDGSTWHVKVKALCSNRNLPATLSTSGDESMFFPNSYVDTIKHIKCLVAPTHAVRPTLGDATKWQLISHLSLNTFSGPDAVHRLKEVLRLYDFKATQETHAFIDNIHDVSIYATTSRLPRNGHICFASGSEILLTFSHDDFSGSGLFFFANVLDHFFSMFASINSFTRLKIKFKDQDVIYHTWPARAGNIPLL
ncbi:type VI secretion system baseplate subunit TssF [Algicola sagamiensis]|uniref:type VI secretion system baseplate subunit TssF n=1 Tax=Algicola sagamiensis TaxID=163869 RepID=UPI00037CF070|nr:type VI secretion system baseplate subunit TssF [Algicola sagamiensis]